VTDELKEKLMSVRHRLEELKQTRTERIRESSRTKGSSALLMNTLTQALSMAMGSETGHGTGYIYESDAMQAAKEDHEVHQEDMAHRDRERLEVEGLVDQELRSDIGCSVSGLYDLVGTFLHSYFSSTSFPSLAVPLPLRLQLIVFVDLQ
jgi:ubiquitin carboxyl-terminal hydrolase 14